MYNVSLRILSHVAEAEDVLQEAFLEAFNRIADFRGDTTFGLWLKQIVINKSINYLRKRKVEFVSTDEVDVVEEEETDEEDLQLQVEEIRKAIQQLPDGYRVVISLYLLEGYDHEEIAHILKISEKSKIKITELNGNRKEIKMSRKLEDYIRENKKAFDIKEPPGYLWERIEAGLDQKKTVRPLRRTLWIGVAASLVLMLGITYMFFNMGRATNPTIADVNPDYMKRQVRFSSLIEEKKDSLEVLAKANPALFNKFKSDMEKMDSDYQKLKQEFSSSPNQNLVGKAMVKNLELQLQLITQQLNIINQLSTAAVPGPDSLSRRQQNDADDAVRSKSFSKSFPLSASDRVSLSNQYGTILIKNWDKREVKVDVDIKAYSDSESEVQKLLEAVSIEADKQGDVASFRTRIGEENKSWGSWFRNGKRGRKEVKVNYVVYMPSSNALSMVMQYGNVEMGDHSGALSMKLQYGNFKAGNLSSNNNYVAVQYGKSTIEELNKATVKHQYGSGLIIGTVGSLNLNAQYVSVNITNIKEDALIKQQYGSGLTIGSVANLNLDVQYSKVNIQSIKKGATTIKQQYGSLDIGSLGSINLRTQYTGVNIGTLWGDGTFDMQYDRLSIGKVTEGVRSLNIDGQYVTMGMEFSDKYNGDLDVRTSYASFRYGKGVTARLTSKDDESTEKSYSGKIGNGGNNRVRVKSDYGSVTFR
eukprot:gene11337-13219_t